MTGRDGLRRLVVIGIAWGIAVASSLSVVAISSAVEMVVGGGGEPDTFAVTLAVLTVITSSVGCLLVIRRPGNWIGRLLATGSTLLAWAFIGYGVAAVRGATYGTDDLAGGLAAVVGTVLLAPAFFLTFVVSVILFPDGRLPGPGWRSPFRGVTVALAVGAALGTFSPWAPTDGLPGNPLALALPSWVAELAGGLSALALILGLAMGAVAILVRYRRSTGMERAQVKWLLASLACAALVFPLSWATDIGPDDGGLVDVLSIVAMALVPLSILVAILRYRLYDIDRLVSRTVSWAIVTGGLAATFVGLLIWLQALLDGVTQGDTVAIAVSTLVAFALFQPLRRSVQRVVDRRFDRERADGERLAAAYADRVRSEVDLPRLVDGLTTTVDDAVRPTQAAVWLRADRNPT